MSVDLEVQFGESLSESSSEGCSESSEATVSVTNVVTHNHICPLIPSNVEVTFLFMDWSAKSSWQKQH